MQATFFLALWLSIEHRHQKKDKRKKSTILYYIITIILFIDFFWRVSIFYFLYLNNWDFLGQILCTKLSEKSKSHCWRLLLSVQPPHATFQSLMFTTSTRSPLQSPSRPADRHRWPPLWFNRQQVGHTGLLFTGGFLGKPPEKNVTEVAAALAAVVVVVLTPCGACTCRCVHKGRLPALCMMTSGLLDTRAPPDDGGLMMFFTFGQAPCSAPQTSTCRAGRPDESSLCIRQGRFGATTLMNLFSAPPPRFFICPFFLSLSRRTQL